MSDQKRREYERDARRLLAAVMEWKLDHDPRELELYLPPRDFFVVAPLDSPLLELVARNEAARTFIAWVDQRTNYQGTLEMFAACVRLAGFPAKEFEAGALQIYNLIPLAPGGND